MPKTSHFSSLLNKPTNFHKWSHLIHQFPQAIALTNGLQKSSTFFLSFSFVPFSQACQQALASTPSSFLFFSFFLLQWMRATTETFFSRATILELLDTSPSSSLGVIIHSQTNPYGPSLGVIIHSQTNPYGPSLLTNVFKPSNKQNNENPINNMSQNLYRGCIHWMNHLFSWLESSK
jgi:hypothetical protein